MLQTLNVSFSEKISEWLFQKLCFVDPKHSLHVYGRPKLKENALFLRNTHVHVDRASKLRG